MTRYSRVTKFSAFLLLPLLASGQFIHIFEVQDENRAPKSDLFDPSQYKYVSPSQLQKQNPIDTQKPPTTQSPPLKQESVSSSSSSSSSLSSSLSSSSLPSSPSSSLSSSSVQSTPSSRPIPVSNRSLGTQLGSRSRDLNTNAYSRLVSNNSVLNYSAQPISRVIANVSSNNAPGSIGAVVASAVATAGSVDANSNDIENEIELRKHIRMQQSASQAENRYSRAQPLRVSAQNQRQYVVRVPAPFQNQQNSRLSTLNSVLPQGASSIVSQPQSNVGDIPSSLLNSFLQRNHASQNPTIPSSVPVSQQYPGENPSHVQPPYAVNLPSPQYPQSIVSQPQSQFLPQNAPVAPQSASPAPVSHFNHPATAPVQSHSGRAIGTTSSSPSNVELLNAFQVPQVTNKESLTDDDIRLIEEHNRKVRIFIQQRETELKADHERNRQQKAAEEAAKEQDRLRRLRAEQEAAIRASQAQAAEQERIRRIKTEQEAAARAQAIEAERVRRMKAEQEAAAEQERIRRIKAEQEQLARLRAEQEEAIRVKEEQERYARHQAQQEAAARAAAEQERQRQLKAQQEAASRAAAEQERQRQLKAQQEAAIRLAEAERIASIRAEQEAAARAAAEQERLARIQAEKEAVARAEAERVAKIKAEQDRIRRLRAEQEHLARLRAEQDAAIRAKEEQERFERLRADQEAAARAAAAEQQRYRELKAQQEAAARMAEAEREKYARLRAEQEIAALQLRYHNTSVSSSPSSSSSSYPSAQNYGRISSNSAHSDATLAYQPETNLAIPEDTYRISSQNENARARAEKEALAEQERLLRFQASQQALAQQQASEQARLRRLKEEELLRAEQERAAREAQEREILRARQEHTARLASIREAAVRQANAYSSPTYTDNSRISSNLSSAEIPTYSSNNVRTPESNTYSTSEYPRSDSLNTISADYLRRTTYSNRSVASARPTSAPVTIQATTIPVDSNIRNGHKAAKISLQELPHDTDGDGIPGQAGRDYPTLTSIPKTSFSCSRQPLNGYYADTETACQVVHMCQAGGVQDSFLCPNGTIWNQEKFACQWWYEVSCAHAPSFYALNDNLYKAEVNNKPSSVATAVGDINKRRN